MLKYKREKVKRCLLIKDKSFPKAQEKGNRRERERSGASWTEMKVQGQASREGGFHEERKARV